MLDKFDINIDILSIKNKGNKKIFINQYKNICTQQNHCFASVRVECIYIMTR